ncbi:L-seryl-tRNA(Sec) selenium transferase [Alkalicoccus chagannorensis]|uniref:L-seryl-tRNA(Sec) selenium transferase n=1 Tax=Alkalicoccus chagannorensis TaxID=427072 RepID=UPI000427DF5A|nr:L-seryl-tRNA(Sec) selenium transferase [Alkalicoccus chagannorensis]
MTDPSYFRYLPPVHEVASAVEEEGGGPETPKRMQIIRKALEEIRTTIADGSFQPADRQEAMQKTMERYQQLVDMPDRGLQRVINAAGTVLHTNLGRAPLSEKAASKVYETAIGYSSLEFDLGSGERGSRLAYLNERAASFCGTEAAMVVNNNAAAVYMVLKALSKHKETVVSRGELVEIGGSFRVSTIMEESGAILREVGTTNKTRYSDYASAVHEETAMVMKVHTSNFAVVGFTETTDTGELQKLKEAYPHLIIYDDLGSGSLYPFQHDGIGDEPVVRESAARADIISFSGDKLLGGPQAGIIAGKKVLIDQLKQHPLARVLRLDKMSIAALESAFDEHENETYPPAVSMITSPQSALMDLAQQRRRDDFQTLTLEPASGVSKVGGGTMPLVELPTGLLRLEKAGWSEASCAAFLRSCSPPLVVRLQDSACWLDMRTISEEEWGFVNKHLEKLDNA